MNLLWVIFVTITAVVAGTGLCLWLLNQAREVATTVWTLEHIICPLVRIIVLMLVISQVYPAFTQTDSQLDFWDILEQQHGMRDLVNFLFIAGLLLAFLPVVNHPAISLPVQTLLTIALVFNWQFKGPGVDLMLFPSPATMLKISAYMLLAYFVMRELSAPLSRRLDRKLNVAGSIRLIADAIYLILQIPVMLIYGSFLKQQIV